jgi:adenosylcobinamide-GDP ribazoletransferase
VTGLGDAFAFLTRLPSPRREETSLDLGRAAAWFPIVGLAVGGITAGVRALAGLALPSAVATVLALLAAVLVTGGLHEDGLADVADAIGAHTTRERRQEILHDPRVGTYGALALIFALLLPTVALTPVSDQRFLRVVLTADVLGRAVAIVVPAGIGQRRLIGSAAAFGDLSPLRVGLGTAAALAIVITASGWTMGLAAVGAVAITAGVTVSLCIRSLGAVNGDALGAVVKITEVTCVLVLVAAAGGR